MKNINDIYMLMDPSWKKTKRNFINFVMNKSEYSQIINNEIFQCFFKSLLDNYEKYKGFKSANHQLNYLKKPFRNEDKKPFKNADEEISINFWKETKQYWSKYKSGLIKNDLNSKSIKKKALFDYYGNINTMVDLHCDEKDEKDKDDFDYNQNFIDNHVYGSFSDNDNNILDLLIKEKNNFKNDDMLKTYVYSNNDSGNPLNIEQLIALNLSHKRKILIYILKILIVLIQIYPVKWLIIFNICYI